MVQSPLSPVLSHAVSADDQSIIHFLMVVHPRVLSQYLSARVQRALLSERRCLIVVDSSDAVATVQASLASYRMGHLISHYDIAPLTPADKEKLQLLTTIPAVDRSTSDISRLEDYIDLIDIRARHAAHQLSQLPLLSDQTMSSLLTSHSAALPQMPQTAPQILLDERVIEHLEELQSLYRDRYYQLIHDDILDDSIYDTYASYADAKEQIDSLLLSSQSLMEDLASLRSNLLSHIHRQIRMEQAVWQEIRVELEHLYYLHESHSAPSISHLVARAVGRADSHQYLTLSDEYRTSYAHSAIPSILDRIEEIIDGADDAKNQKSTEYWQRLTPFNTKSDRLSSLQMDILALYQQIDATEWLAIPMRERALTLSQLESGLINTITSLRRCESIVSDHHYVQWRRLAAEMDLSMGMLEQLIAYDGDLSWQQLAQSTALISIARRVAAQQVEMLTDQLEHVATSRSEWAADTVHNLLCQQRDEAIESLVEESPRPILHMLQGILEGQSIASLLQSHHELLLALQPVILIDMSDLESLDLSSWDEVILYDVKSVNPSHIQSWMEIESHVSIATSHPVHLNEIQKQWTTELYFSHEIPADISGSIYELQRSDRYRVARSLATYIHSCRHRYSIYRTRDRCIVSLLPAGLNDHIIDQLQSPDLNVLHLHSDQIEDLTDALVMVGTEVYLLYADGTLSGRGDHLLWQRQVMKMLTTSGVHLIDVSTSALLQSYPNAMRKIVQSLTEITVETV